MLFIQLLFRSPVAFLVHAVVILFSVCLHEYFHARAALFFGDDTAARNGHLSLNPLRQMGIYSLIIFALVGFCWGAVPVNPHALRRNSKWAVPAVSFAGPAANLLIFIVSVIWGMILMMLWSRNQEIDSLAVVIQILQIFGSMNLFLFVFNLLPIPGLDGWNILAEFVPATGRISSEVVKSVIVILIFLALAFTNVIMEISSQCTMFLFMLPL